MLKLPLDTELGSAYLPVVRTPSTPDAVLAVERSHGAAWLLPPEERGRGLWSVETPGFSGALSEPEPLQSGNLSVGQK